MFYNHTNFGRRKTKEVMAGIDAEFYDHTNFGRCKTCRLSCRNKVCFTTIQILVGVKLFLRQSGEDIVLQPYKF